MSQNIQRYRLGQETRIETGMFSPCEIVKYKKQDVWIVDNRHKKGKWCRWVDVAQVQENNRQLKEKVERLSARGIEAMQFEIDELKEENALLTKKLDGLEDIDDNKGSLIKIIEGAIEDFEGIGYNYEANDLRKKLKEVDK